MRKKRKVAFLLGVLGLALVGLWLHVNKRLVYVCGERFVQLYKNRATEDEVWGELMSGEDMKYFLSDGVVKWSDTEYKYTAKKVVYTHAPELSDDFIGQMRSDYHTVFHPIQEMPVSNYTGIWNVYYTNLWDGHFTNSSPRWIESHYESGLKHGEETRWYADTGYKMSLHTFKKGVLDGKAIKWRNNKESDVIVEGDYHDGKPWNGTFLEGKNQQVDTTLQVTEINTYWIQEYKEGEMFKRYKSSIKQ